VVKETNFYLFLKKERLGLLPRVTADLSGPITESDYKRFRKGKAVLEYLS
jgi:hypothetical protein